MNIISVTEHDDLTPGQLQSSGVDLRQLPAPANARAANYLGLSVSGWPDQKVTAGYYVGVSWLIKGESALIVRPKIDGLDFTRMFLTALESREDDIQDKLTEIYGIDFNAEPVPVGGLPVDLTPMLMIHFIKLLNPIVSGGLRRNYTFEEENLHGKLKGKLLMARHIKHNVMRGVMTHNYCRHQQYGENCIENRILRIALDIAAGYLSRFCKNYHRELQSEIIRATRAFESVGNRVAPSEIARYKVNPLFRGYARAIRVATHILRRYGYDIRNLDSKVYTSTPPFWIDMPLLFELYTLSLLRSRYGRLISYHITSRGNEIDFGKADERLIIDAKYKHRWCDNIDHSNIRQLSGYARNISLRRKLTGYDDTDTIFPCMIVYPDHSGAETLTAAPDKLLSYNGIATVDSYVNFSKLGIRLPTLT